MLILSEKYGTHVFMTDTDRTLALRLVIGGNERKSVKKFLNLSLAFEKYKYLIEKY